MDIHRGTELHTGQVHNELRQVAEQVPEVMVFVQRPARPATRAPYVMLQRVAEYLHKREQPLQGITKK